MFRDDIGYGRFGGIGRNKNYSNSWFYVVFDCYIFLF